MRIVETNKPENLYPHRQIFRPDGSSLCECDGTKDEVVMCELSKARTDGGQPPNQTDQETHKIIECCHQATMRIWEDKDK